MKKLDSVYLFFYVLALTLTTGLLIALLYGLSKPLPYSMYIAIYSLAGVDGICAFTIAGIKFLHWRLNDSPMSRLHDPLERQCYKLFVQECGSIGRQYNILDARFSVHVGEREYDILIKKGKTTIKRILYSSEHYRIHYKNGSVSQNDMKNILKFYGYFIGEVTAAIQKCKQTNETEHQEYKQELVNFIAGKKPANVENMPIIIEQDNNTALIDTIVKKINAKK